MNPKTVTTLRRVGVALAVILVIALAVFWFTRPKPIAVVVTEVQRGTVESSIANTRAGTVESCQRTKLSTIIGGRIEVLAVKEGDRVKKGQLLMQIWHDDIKAQERLARGGARDLAPAGGRSLHAGRQRRARGEAAGGTAQTGLHLGQCDRHGARGGRRPRGVVRDRQGRRRAGQRQRNVAQVQQGRTTLVAPFDGTVAKIVGEIGEYSTPSPPGVPTPPAIDLIDESCVYVNAPMDEIDAPKIREGQFVRITLDALPGKSFSGKVRRIAPYVAAVEKQARTVDVEATFDNPAEAGRLLVGYSADIEIVLDTRNDVLRVPASALLEGGRVLVVDADSTLVERKLKTGLSNWEYTEVVEGLAAGDRIVTSLERAGVKAGARVTVESKPAK